MRILIWNDNMYSAFNIWIFQNNFFLLGKGNRSFRAILHLEMMFFNMIWGRDQISPLPLMVFQFSHSSRPAYCATQKLSVYIWVDLFLGCVFCSVYFVFDLMPHCLNNYSFILHSALSRTGLPCLSQLVLLRMKKFHRLKQQTFNSGGWVIQDQGATISGVCWGSSSWLADSYLLIIS